MAIYKVKKGIKYDEYSVLGFKFKRLSAHYNHELSVFNACKDTPLLENGLSLRANFNEISGESQVAKDFCSLLEYGSIAHDKNGFWDIKDCPKYKNCINFSTSDYIKHPQYHNATVAWWEFESGMLEVRPYLFDNINAVIVFSTFCYNYIKQIIPQHIQLYQILYPFNFDTLPSFSQSEMRKKYHLSDDDFVLFFNFSYFSSYYRKNPEFLLEVFKDSFEHKNNVKLFIKTNGIRPSYQKKLREKILMLGLSTQVILEEQNLSRQEMINILNMCDVYVSLHRGEGLGLGMLEAMSLGKTVVATNYGGNQDFIKDDFAYPIAYSLVKPQQIDVQEYRFVKEWAEPDKEQSIASLRQLYDNRQLCAEMGKKAKDFVHDSYSFEKALQVLKETIPYC